MSSSIRPLSCLACDDGYIPSSRPDSPQPGCGQVKGGGAAKAARAHDENSGFFQPDLPAKPNPGNDDLPAETKKLFSRQVRLAAGR